MKGIRLCVLTVFGVLVAVGCLRYGQACNVQGIIDWRDWSVGPSKRAFLIQRERWGNPAGGGRALENFAAWDDDVFLPKADHRPGRGIGLGILAGACLIEGSGYYCDWYELWAWADVNGNGEADSEDKVFHRQTHQWVSQSWQMVWHRTPSVNNLASDLVQAGDTVDLIPGMCYLLLIRVHSVAGTNFDFTGTVSVTWPSAQIVSTTAVTDNWGKDEVAGNPYGGKDGTGWNGIEDFEVLWVRIIAPPAVRVPGGRIRRP